MPPWFESSLVTALSLLKCPAALDNHHHPSSQGLEHSLPHTKEGREVFKGGFLLLCYVSLYESSSFLPVLSPPFLDLCGIIIESGCPGLCLSLGLPWVSATSLCSLLKHPPSSSCVRNSARYLGDRGMTSEYGLWSSRREEYYM